jgi:methionyl-tRNA formyltransferase
MKVLITAGFDRSLPALAVAELLRRARVTIGGVLVATPWSAGRIRPLLGRMNARELRTLARKFRGHSQPGPMRRFMERETIHAQPLSAWAEANRIPLRKVGDLNGDAAIEFARTCEPEWVVYSGGGILRRPFLSGGTWRVINAHLGPLPEIRGMNAAEWAVLMKLPPSATIHLIDEGIDTGGTFASAPVDLSGVNTVDSLREQAVVTGVEAMVKTLCGFRDGRPVEPQTHGELHRQCFTLSPALRELAEHRLAVLAGGSR